MEPTVKPWENEPNDLAFIATSGLDCRIHRNLWAGNLCGYVKVPEGHLLYGKGYSAAIPDELRSAWTAVCNGEIGKRGIIDVFTCGSEGRVGVLFDVHGGITWADNRLPWEDKTPTGWWLGFDCAHDGDLSPGYENRFSSDGEYRDIEYVKAECESLASQIVALNGATK